MDAIIKANHSSEGSATPPPQEVPNPTQAELLHALSLAKRATELDSQAEYCLAINAYQSAIGSIHQAIVAAETSSLGIDGEARQRLEDIVGSYKDRVSDLQMILQGVTIPTDNLNH